MQILLNLTIKQTIFEHDFQNHAKGMLPIADKPIAAYYIDKLAEQGCQTVFIATTDKTEMRSRQLGDGSFWSLHIHYLNVDTPIGLNAYTQLQEQGLKEVHADLPLLGKPTHQSDEYFEHYDTFLNDNIGVLTRTDLYQLESYQVRPNIFSSEGVKTKAMSDFPIHLGKYSQLKTRCIFRGPAVIGSGAIVEHGSILDNTVIMPNTHVGSDLDLSNCLVTPQWIYHQMTKECIDIEEPQLISFA